MRVVKVTWRVFHIFWECFAGFLLIYWLCAVILSHWTVPGPADQHPVAVSAYITSNGVHTDIVVPIRTSQIDWGTELGITNELEQDSSYSWLSFGWGNKDFFLQTKDWSDLKARVAFNAAFHLGTSAMHLVQEREPNASDSLVVPLLLTSDQYKKLVVYLEQSFERENGKYIEIKTHLYGKQNFFFEAEGSYGLTFTCNSWTNKALKASGQRACAWTPFKDGIFLQYR